MGKYKIDDYIGKKIYHVTVKGIDTDTKNWIFECECGNTFLDTPRYIINGHKKSCGCWKINHAKTHGLNGDEFYHTWWNMMQRCYNPEHHNYPRYGARGITVCEEWHDVKNFIEWARSTIGHKVKGLTMDRKDNNGNYCPENCKWSTASQQQRNKRNTVMVTIDNQTKPLIEWCEFYNIKCNTVRMRIKSGWNIEEAIKTPTDSVIHQPEKRICDKYYTIDGETKNISDLCKIYGKNKYTVYGRLNRGWSIKDALTLDSNSKSRKMF